MCVYISRSRIISSRFRESKSISLIWGTILSRMAPSWINRCVLASRSFFGFLLRLLPDVDDMVLFDNSKKRLHAAIRTVGDYLQHMQMRLKSTWQVYHLRIRPLDFLGFKFHANGKITLRKSILYRISRKARTIARKGYASVTNASGMISYKGYMDHSDPPDSMRNGSSRL